MLKEYDFCRNIENNKIYIFIENNGEFGKVKEYRSGKYTDIKLNRLIPIPRTILKDNDIDQVLYGKITFKKLLSKANVHPNENYSIEYHDQISLDKLIDILENVKSIVNNIDLALWANTINDLLCDDTLDDDVETCYFWNADVELSLITLDDDYYPNMSYICKLFLKEIIMDPKVDTLNKYINWLKTFKYNMNLAIKDRTYLKEDKIYFLNLYFDGIKEINKESEEIKALYREFLIDLANEGDKFYLSELGYYYYGYFDDENVGFPHDFLKAKEIFEKLIIDNNDECNGSYAEILGEIYFYGKASNGIKDSEKAFKYFSLAEIYKKTKATCLLSDMYLNGLSTVRDYNAAYKLVNGIYETSCNHFKAYFDNDFYNVAYRMANFYKNGYGVTKDGNSAYYYFKLAKFALEKADNKDNSLNSIISSNILDFETTNKINLKAKYITNNYIIGEFIFSFLKEYKVCKAIIKEFNKYYEINISQNTSLSFSQNIILFNQKYGYLNVINNLKIKILKSDLIDIYINSNNNKILFDDISFNNSNIIKFNYRNENIFCVTTNSIKYKIR